jgi:hypothetical protein
MEEEMKEMLKWAEDRVSAFNVMKNAAAERYILAVEDLKGIKKGKPNPRVEAIYYNWKAMRPKK